MRVAFKTFLGFARVPEGGPCLSCGAAHDPHDVTVLKDSPVCTVARMACGAGCGGTWKRIVHHRGSK